MKSVKIAGMLVPTLKSTTLKVAVEIRTQSKYSWFCKQIFGDSSLL